MVKRLPDSGHVRRSIENVRAYRNDLDDILALVGAVGLNVAIIVGQNQYDSVDEVREHCGDRPKRLTIIGTKPDSTYRIVEVEFRDDDVSLSMAIDQLGATGVRLGDVVERLRFNAPYLSPKLWWSVPLVIAVIGATLEVAGHGIIPLWAVWAAWGLVPVAHAVGKRLRGLHLTRHHEGGFWKRNADKIIIALITAVIVQFLNWILRK